MQIKEVDKGQGKDRERDTGDEWDLKHFSHVGKEREMVFIPYISMMAKRINDY